MCERNLTKEISSRALTLYLMDLRQLRGKYAMVRVDLPRTWIDRLKRPALVDTILVQEFGEDAMITYKTRCKVWDEMKKFVMGSRKPEKMRVDSDYS